MNRTGGAVTAGALLLAAMGGAEARDFTVTAWGGAVQVETAELVRGCEEGICVPIDWSKIGGPPTSVADFWNLDKGPGKRGMRVGPKVNLGFALIADGVAPGDVYKVLSTPEGIDRAFAKLDQIKPQIQFWKAGAQQ